MGKPGFVPAPRVSANGEDSEPSLEGTPIFDDLVSAYEIERQRRELEQLLR